MKKLKILVGGFAVGFPLGGQVWMMVHFMRGLQKLGHEVLFIEDTAEWALPFDPVKGYASADSSHGRAVLQDIFEQCDLAGRWAYNSIFDNTLYGMEREALERFCAEADLFINISGVIPLRESYMLPKVRAIIDTDPVFTQNKIAEDDWTREYYLRHDMHFTVGYNIPTGIPGIPTSGLDWQPLCPPVDLDLWPVLDTPGTGFSTIGSWDSQGRDMVHEGKKLSWRKCEKYEQIIDLPSRLPGVVLDLTMSGMKEDAARFAAHGWNVRDALTLSRDLMAYREYVQHSTAEFTVAKEQNIVLKSGWFSDRSATYLASGRPVIVEDTGFGTFLPLGEGLVTFEGVDNAKAAIENVLADYPKHRRGARRIAEEFFDSNKVLQGLLKTCGF